MLRELKDTPFVMYEPGFSLHVLSSQIDFIIDLVAAGIGVASELETGKRPRLECEKPIRLASAPVYAVSGATIASSSLATSRGSSRACRPRWPPLTKTYGSASASASIAVLSRRVWPNGLTPPIL